MNVAILMGNLVVFYRAPPHVTDCLSTQTHMHTSVADFKVENSYVLDDATMITLPKTELLKKKLSIHVTGYFLNVLFCFVFAL